MRSHSMSPWAGDHPRLPEQTQPTHAAEDAHLTPFGMCPESDATSTRGRSFVDRPGLGGYQAAPLDYPVSMCPYTFLPLANQGDGYAQAAYSDQAFAYSTIPAASNPGGYVVFDSGSTVPHQAPFVSDASLHLQAYHQNNFRGIRTQDNYLQAPPSRVCLRGGANSPAEDNTEQPATNADPPASGPDSEDDSLYRADFTPRNLNGELSEVLGGRTHANGATSEIFGPEHPQHGVPVHRPHTPANGLYAPVRSLDVPVYGLDVPVHGPHTPEYGPSAPVNTPSAPINTPSAPINSPPVPIDRPSAPVNNLYARVNGFRAPDDGIHAPADGLHAPINSIHTRVPYPARSSIEGDTDVPSIHTRIPNQAGSSSQGDIYIPSINRRIPYPGRYSAQGDTHIPNVGTRLPYPGESSIQGNTHDLAGAHVNRDPSALPPMRNSADNSTHSRIYGMTDGQREQNSQVIDWWFCEPLGRVPSGAPYSSSVDPHIAANYFGPSAPPDWRQDYNYNVGWGNYNYNPTAGFEMQQQNVGYNLFPHQQNGTFSQMPVQPQGPSFNMMPAYPGPPYHQQTAPEVPSMIPAYSDVHRGDLHPATAQPANTNTDDERRFGTRTREVLDRLRGTRNSARSRLGRGVFRGRGGSRRH